MMMMMFLFTIMMMTHVLKRNYHTGLNATALDSVERPATLSLELKT